MSNKGKTLPAEVFSKDEVGRFLETFRDSLTGRRNRCMFLLAHRCQLRSDEITSLRTCDIDHNRGCVTIMKGKGGKRRVVGCDSDTLKEIADYLRSRDSDSELLFVSHKGNRLDNSYLRKIAKRHGRIAGIKKRVHVHGFRHTGACHLAEEGVQVRVISRQLGHSSIATTSRYLDHLGAGEVVEAIQQVNW